METEAAAGGGAATQGCVFPGLLYGHGWFRTSDLSRVKRYRRSVQWARKRCKSGPFGTHGGRRLLGLLEMIGRSADVGKNAALGLPVQRAAFRSASSGRSVEVPVERQREVAPVERRQ